MTLSTLPFGEDGARPINNVNEVSELLGRVVPPLQFESLTPNKIFRMKLASSKVGGITLLAFSAPPCRFTIDKAEGWRLVLPTVGKVTVQCDGKSYSMRSGADALLVPDLPRIIESGAGAGMIVSIDIGRLERTLAILTESRAGDVSLARHPHPLPLRKCKNLFPGFLKICSLIDLTLGKGDIGKSLGLEDMIYRWMALALASQRGPTNNAPPEGEGDEIDIVCSLIRSRPEHSLTLVEIQAASGLSARSLQYAFKARFDCTPMEWQRRERMLEVQRRLMNLQPGETITTLAHAMGFSTSAAFSALYRRQFGEAPSEVVRRNR